MSSSTILLGIIEKLTMEVEDTETAIKKSRSIPEGDLGHQIWLGIANDRIKQNRECLEELTTAVANL